MEQASSALKSWLASCLSCVWSPGEVQVHNNHQARDSDSGIEREMKICHDQPHLVPPMRLILYDDLPPSPTIRSRSSTISHLVTEGRNLAAKASDRASLSIRRISLKPSRKLAIGSPHDFRRVPPRSRVSPFRPLELSIYSPGNRLSDLPEFDHFDLEDPEWLRRPPNVFSPVEDYRRYSDLPPFKVPRKPVSLTTHRSSGRMEVLDRRCTLPEPLVGSQQASPRPDSPIHVRSKSEPLRDTPSPTNTERQAEDELVLSNNLLNEVPPLPELRSAGSPNERSTLHSRSRTLSGSTITSAKLSRPVSSGRSMSISSALTSTTIRPSPSMSGILEKEYEATFDSSSIKHVPSRLHEPLPPLPVGKESRLTSEAEYHERINGVGLAF
ncbi:hypothetical protein AJ80_04506 [Polytolypa hystricis UAMH7299]|uniref:Uncharacterized protein n=1 Tax=Polytolypa hystricis (strain UAMH7299) TaxID=1447883 RepID=A0A2B7YBN8_POLH7|nr:hypothetical protein AJ80_04506 [Polytolypa hystricis UAMH7299]